MVEQHSSSMANDTGVLIVLGVLTVTFFIYQKIKPLKLDKDLPTLDKSHYHFLLGHLPYLLSKTYRWPTEVTKLNKKFKRTWGAVMPSLPFLPSCTLFINDEVNVKHVLNDNFDNYVKGKVFEGWFRDFLGDGIFAVDGIKWKVHRKLMSHMFSRNLLRDSATIMRQKLEGVLQDMEHAIDADHGVTRNGRKTAQFDFQGLMLRLMFDVTSKFAFGVDLNTVSNNSKEEQHPFFAAFDRIAHLIYGRGSDVFYPIKRKLGIGSEKLIAESLRTINDFAMDLIAERRINVEKGVHIPTSDHCAGKGNGNNGNFDLVSKYIEHAQKENEDISDRDLRDIVVNVMFAGRDTTAYALSWALYELERHPIVKEKLISEVNSVCGTGEEADYSFDTMNKLKYTHCVILEVMRLHPTLPENIRYAVKSDTLPDGTRVPQGAGISLSFYSMGRTEELWGKDAAEFKPERFMGEKEPSPYMFTAFHAGPRFCLGKPLAFMNMKLVLSILLTSGIEFKDRVGHSGDYNYAITMSMKDSFPIEISCC
mmetsp:Transcript_43302/g.79256  ORF Transcript_43302/g.79256 Transcript_43302/m.79256 type:complete len:536 (-) Transcript_43302:98-1705(-)